MTLGRKADDRMISVLETTMSGLTFTKDATGLVRIQDENGDVPDNVEPASILELTPPPTPTRDGKLGTANIIPMEILCLILEFVNPKRQDVFAATSKVSRLWYHASAPFLSALPALSSLLCLYADGGSCIAIAALRSPGITTSSSLPSSRRPALSSSHHPSALS